MPIISPTAISPHRIGDKSWSSYWANTIMPDGHTVGWYVAGDGSATYVTKDGSDFVSVWKDLSGANHPLNQATGTNQPKWESDGILFDGVDNFMKSAPFTYNQPEFVYLVLKQVTWTKNDIIVDGNTNLSGALRQRATTPGLMIYVTAYSGQNDGLAVNTWGIVRYLINGASSKITINGNAPVTADVGTGNMGGITLCKRGDDNDFFGHVKIAEAIFRNAADDATTEAAIYAYLKNKYSL